MSDWLTDTTANRYRKSYFKDFLDLSGNLTVRNGDFDISGGDATISGSIGIGTTSPGHKMDIVGTDTMLRLTNLTAGGRTTQIFKTDDADWEIGARGSTNGSAPSSFYIYDTDFRMVIDSGGNIGIGTTSPTHGLSITKERLQSTVHTYGVHMGRSNSTGSYGQMVISGSVGCEIDFSEGSTTVGRIAYTHSSNMLYFATNGTSSDMVIDVNGNVGIGTTSPAAILDVNGSIRGGYDSDTLSYFGRVAIGGNPGSSHEPDHAYFSHIDQQAATSFALRQNFNGTTVINAASGQHMHFRIANSDKMVLTDDGYVGIGTTSPTGQLHVHEDSTSSNTMIKLTHSTTGTSNASDGFDLVLERTSNDAYIIQRESAEMFFRTSNTDRMVINSGGQVGIGLTSLNGVPKLHVAAGSGTFGSSTNFRYFTTSDLTNKYGLGSCSIIADDDVVSGGAIASYSDRRIKKNIVEINDASSLEKLRLLKPSYYEYIDPIKKNYDVVEGFIAQEVKEVLPYAVKLIDECVPNIFQRGNCDVDSSGNNVITLSDYDTANLELDASGNIYPNVKLYDPSDNEIEITINEVISSTKLRVESDKDIPSEVFVYGQHVDNFNYLQKERVFTVGISALQEVDRQQQADKTRIATLETENATLKTQMADVLARLAALENA